MSVLNLYIDVQNGVLVESTTSTSAARLRDWIQNDNPTINLYPLAPANSVSAPYTQLDLAQSTLKIALCGGTGQPTGTIGGPSPIAYQDSNYDAVTNPGGFRWFGDHWSGKLNLNTLGFASFLGANSSAGTTFEIEPLDPDGSESRFQFPATAKACVIEDGTAVPVPIPQFYSQTTTPAGDVTTGSLWFNPSNSHLYAFVGGWNEI